MSISIIRVNIQMCKSEIPSTSVPGLLSEPSKSSISNNLNKKSEKSSVLILKDYYNKSTIEGNKNPKKQYKKLRNSNISKIKTTEVNRIHDLKNAYVIKSKPPVINSFVMFRQVKITSTKIKSKKKRLPTLENYINGMEIAKLKENIAIGDMTYVTENQTMKPNLLKQCDEPRYSIDIYKINEQFYLEETLRKHLICNPTIFVNNKADYICIQIEDENSLNFINKNEQISFKDISNDIFCRDIPKVKLLKYILNINLIFFNFF